MANLGGHCVDDPGGRFQRRPGRTSDLLSGLHDQGLGHATGRAQGQPRRPDDRGTRWPTFQTRNGGAGRRRNGSKMAAVEDPAAFQDLAEQNSLLLQWFTPTNCHDAAYPCPGPRRAEGQAEISTQAAFGKILDEIARGDTPLSRRIVTTSAGRHRLHQPRRFRQPTRPLGPGRTWPTPSATSQHPLGPEMAFFSPRRPAHRTWHRRDEPLPPPRRRRPFPRALRRAPDPHRHGL